MISGIENIKNSKNKFVRISSDDKSSGTNNKFTVNLEASGGVLDNVKGFIVHSSQVPNIFPNVPSYANSLQLVRQTGPVVYNISVDVGQYLITDFITALQFKINAAIGPDTVIITLDSQNKLNFSFSADNWELSYSNSTIRDIIGLSSSNDGFFFTVATLANPVNLIGETECYIHSRVLASNNLFEGDGAFSVVDKINLDKPYGSTCYSNYNNDTTHMISYFPYETKKTLRTIDINLRNRTGELMVLPDNYSFTMMIKIFYS